MGRDPWQSIHQDQRDGDKYYELEKDHSWLWDDRSPRSWPSQHSRWSSQPLAFISVSCGPIPFVDQWHFNLPRGMSFSLLRLRDHLLIQSLFPRRCYPASFTWIDATSLSRPVASPHSSDPSSRLRSPHITRLEVTLESILKLLLHLPPGSLTRIRIHHGHIRFLPRLQDFIISVPP